MGLPQISEDADPAGAAAVPIAGETMRFAPPVPQVRQWGSRPPLSSIAGGLASSLKLDRIETFLAERPFERMAWLAVAMLFGIIAWFTLPMRADWLLLIGACAGVSGAALLLPAFASTPLLRSAIVAMALMIAAGCAIIWARSTLVGAAPIGSPIVANFAARVLERQEEPARDRVRLIVATADPRDGRTIRARINVREDYDRPFLHEGAIISMRARLVPPSRALLPGGYDFARAAWFDGLSATGSALDPPVLLTREGEATGSGEESWRSRLTDHVRSQVGRFASGFGIGQGGDASAAAIGATFVTGDRGGIREEDAAAMRDSGLAHLLSISGLHVAAVVALAWMAAIRGLALWPWLALRVPLPFVAGTAGAMAGLGYTLLTGGEVPTIRSCIAAVLVLIALALGRQALSLRLIAVAALLVMLFLPEAVVGASFQMSFAAVIAIVALQNSAPMRRLTTPREAGFKARAGRSALNLLITGLAVEWALMPIVLYHFHRAGIYGALANLLAIPLTTAVTMPALFAAVLLDGLIPGFNLGAPAWWVAGQSLVLLLGVARFTAAQPGATFTLPLLPGWALALAAFGGLWLALWSGRVRLWGLLPIALAAGVFALRSPADVLIVRDARSVGVTDREGHLYLLKERESFARNMLVEAAAPEAPVRSITEWPGARCNRDFCAIEMEGDGHPWQLLLARRRSNVDYAALVAACAASDIVIAQRTLPRACEPSFLKADRALLSRRGGAIIDLDGPRVRYVSPGGDDHGW